jgi:hypothetical protein
MFFGKWIHELQPLVTETNVNAKKKPQIRATSAGGCGKGVVNGARAEVEHKTENP